MSAPQSFPSVASLHLGGSIEHHRGRWCWGRLCLCSQISPHHSALRVSMSNPWPMQIITECCLVAGLYLLPVSHLDSGTALLRRGALPHWLLYHVLLDHCMPYSSTICMCRGGCCCSWPCPHLISCSPKCYRLLADLCKPMGFPMGGLRNLPLSCAQLSPALLHNVPIPETIASLSDCNSCFLKN